MTCALAAASPLAVRAQSPCPVAGFPAVLTPPAASAELEAPWLEVSCTDEHLIVVTNGVPDFALAAAARGELRERRQRWWIPRAPQAADVPTPLPIFGPIGVALNGLPLYTPNAGADLGYADPLAEGVLDFCNGHVGADGAYHFHARPDCLAVTAAGEVSPLIGYAFDGFPILAPWRCADADCETLHRVRSSWRRTGHAADPWQGYEYVAGAGDLDECNGAVGPDGGYAYYATDSFPYLLGCYRGTPARQSHRGPDPFADTPPRSASRAGEPAAG